MPRMVKAILRRWFRRGERRTRPEWYSGADNLLLVHPAGEYLRRHEDRLHAIRALLGMPDEEYEVRVLGPIRRYVEMVGELPASRHHHHRKPGGLASHGIEVSHIALRLAEERRLVVEGSPARRRALNKLYSLLLLYGGLCHDPGKVAIFFRVSDEARKNYWNPRIQTLYAWAGEHGLEQIWYEWARNDPRYPNADKVDHVDANGTLLPLIIGHENLRWLNESIIDGLQLAASDMLMALVTGKELEAAGNSMLSELIREADKESVTMDLALDPPATMDPASLAQLILDELVGMYNAGELQVNRPGGYLWQMRDGLYVFWEGVFPIIRARLTRRMINMPADPVVAANHLIKESLAVPALRSGHQAALHWIHPENHPHGIEALKLNNPGQYFRTYPLSDKPLRDMEREEELREALGAEEGVSGEDTGEMTGTEEASADRAVPDEEARAAGQPRQVAESEMVREGGVPAGAVEVPCPEEPGARGRAETEQPGGGSAPPARSEPENGHAPEKAIPEPVTVGVDATSKKGTARGGAGKKAERQRRAEESLRRKLLAKDEGGEVLQAVIAQIGSGRIREGEHYWLDGQGRICLAWPAVMRLAGQEPAKAQKRLAVDGMLEPRKGNLSQHLHQDHGHQVLVLKEEIGALLRDILDVRTTGPTAGVEGGRPAGPEQSAGSGKKPKRGKAATTRRKESGAEGGGRHKAGRKGKRGGGSRGDPFREAVLVILRAEGAGGGKSSAVGLRVLREELDRYGMWMDYEDLKRRLDQIPEVRREKTKVRLDEQPAQPTLPLVNNKKKEVSGNGN